jgi:uncharacterized protein (DUF1800 family)
VDAERLPNREVNMPATTAQLAHLLSRTGTRVNPNRLAQLASLDIADAVNQVCDFSQNPQLNLPQRSAFDGEWKWGEAIRNQWVDRLATLPNPLEAKLTLFWHGHFAASNSKVGSYIYMVDYYKQLATLGHGPFEPLCQAIALDTAMLIYLDNRSNTKSSPQENFARELMELFVLGVNRGYTQDDVREAARAWTGYGLRWDPAKELVFPEFSSSNHDAGDKTIFGITKKWTGPQVIQEMCSGSRQRQTAEFLAAKLWSFFAHENPDAGLVSSLADDYIAVGLHTLNFLKRMFGRSEFYSDRAMQGRVKSPIEWGAMVLASTGLTSDQVGILGYAASGGHDLFNPPNVAGWKLNNVWLNESTFWSLDGAMRNATWRALGDDKLSPSMRPLFKTIPSLTVPNAVDLVIRAFGLTVVSAATRSALETWLADFRIKNGWGQEAPLIRLVALSTEARLA